MVCGHISQSRTSIGAQGESASRSSGRRSGAVRRRGSCGGCGGRCPPWRGRPTCAPPTSASSWVARGSASLCRGAPGMHPACIRGDLHMRVPPQYGRARRHVAATLAEIRPDSGWDRPSLEERFGTVCVTLAAFERSLAGFGRLRGPGSTTFGRLGPGVSGPRVRPMLGRVRPTSGPGVGA